MSDIKVSEIKSDKKDLYKAFLSIGLVEDEENFRITLNDDLNSSFPTKDKEDNFTLGAFIEHQLVGVVSFERDGSNREKLQHKGILFRMYVSKDFRGIGIAKKLIQELIDKVIRIKDIEQINLTVISSNKNAKVLYEKFNFLTFGSEENAIKWKDKYFSEDQMVLKINS